MKRRRIITALLLLAAGCIALTVSVVPYTTTYRNARYARMSLEEQLQDRAQHNDDSLYLTHLGRKLNRSQRFAEARPLLERAVGLDPEAAAARDEWAQALIGTGQISAAFNELRQYRDTHTKAAEAHFLLGKFFVTQEHWTPALRALEETVKLDPNQAEPWSMLAHVHIKMRDRDGAQEPLERAIRLNPNVGNDHLQLAVMLSTRDTRRAHHEYARAVELMPNNAVAHAQYSQFLLNSATTLPPNRKRGGPSPWLRRIVFRRCCLDAA